MNFPGNFTRIAILDVTELKQKVLDVPDSQWRSEAFRQQRYEVHRDTQTISLVFDPDFRHTHPTKLPALQQFANPGGPLSVAAGLHYREDEITGTPGHITYDPVTGESNSWLDDAAGITTGDDTTYAVFGEVDVPLLADRPGFQNLTLNASARYTDVDSYGSDTTWKAGINWQFLPSMRLRANRGTSFRSPALYELHLADQTSNISQRSDPCIQYEQNFQNGAISNNVYQNCIADPAGLPPDYTGGTITPTVFTGGGAGLLEAETSTSQTIGLIWQPEFANLSVSVDYFDIEVLDEIDQLGGAQIIASCYESDFGFAFGNTEPLCQLFDRSSINDGIDNVRDSFINIARQRNRGYDFALRYITDLQFGNFTIDLKATRQVEDVQALFEDTSQDLNGRVGDPEWVGESNVTFQRNSWQAYWGMDYIGTSSSAESFGRNFVTYRGVNYDAVLGTDAETYHSFSVSYEFANQLVVLGGIANAFDKESPQLTAVQASPSEYQMVGNALLASQYDPLGRRFFLNVTKTFE
ncbi:MAG: TonB-dependent receptor [Woeseiaceae bacterium]|nr:TonB-dependent receptor [Woeseiaceae bacterium]